MPLQQGEHGLAGVQVSQCLSGAAVWLSIRGRQHVQHVVHYHMPHSQPASGQCNSCSSAHHVVSSAMHLHTARLALLPLARWAAPPASAPPAPQAAGAPRLLRQEPPLAPYNAAIQTA